MKSTITQFLFYQKAPHLERINALWKAEMETSKVLLAHTALLSLPALFSGLLVWVSAVVALFSAVLLSAGMWPQNLASPPEKPCHARQ